VEARHLIGGEHLVGQRSQLFCAAVEWHSVEVRVSTPVACVVLAQDACDVILTQRRRAGLFPSWALLTVAAITWLGDLVFQLAQGLIDRVPAHLPRGPEMSYTDYTAVAWFARDATGIPATAWKLALLVGTVAYSSLLALAMRRAVRRRRQAAALASWSVHGPSA